MHQYQERNGGEYRKPRGKARVKIYGKSRIIGGGRIGQDKLKDIHNHSGDHR